MQLGGKCMAGGLEFPLDTCQEMNTLRFITIENLIFAVEIIVELEIY